MVYIITLSTCANNPSWLLCRVVSRTNSLACDAKCSNNELCEPCLWFDPNVGWCPGELPEPLDPELEVLANTFPTLGCRTKFGLIGGAFNDKRKDFINKIFKTFIKWQKVLPEF